jgi:hypothetical protein
MEQHQDVSGAQRVGVARSGAETQVGVELAPLRGKSRGLHDSPRVWILLRSGGWQRAPTPDKWSNDGKMFAKQSVL